MGARSVMRAPLCKRGRRQVEEWRVERAVLSRAACKALCVQRSQLPAGRLLCGGCPGRTGMRNGQPPAGLH